MEATEGTQLPPYSLVDNSVKPLGSMTWLVRPEIPLSPWVHLCAIDAKAWWISFLRETWTIYHRGPKPRVMAIRVGSACDTYRNTHNTQQRDDARSGLGNACTIEPERTAVRRCESHDETLIL